MLVDNKIPGKLERILERYKGLSHVTLAPVAMEMAETKEHFRQEPGRGTGLKWRKAPPGTKWGGEGITAWFRGSVRLPGPCEGLPVFVRADTGGETLFVVDGEHRGVFDRNHPVVLLTAKGRPGSAHHLAFEAYSGHYLPGCGPDDQWGHVGARSRLFGGVDLVLARRDVIDFIRDLGVLLQLYQVLDANSLRRGRIMAELARVFAVVDAMPAETGEASWRPKLAVARKIMAPLLAARNGPTAPWFGVSGHSHIDTAWLWTLAETSRKCARTFSSVLNLMEQYPEFTFMQSQPCQTDMVRRDYPGIFKRIQGMVKAGRWDPNGAMWVEPDCNIPSGESFVRQLLAGQAATREMFGYTSDTLWLPDVFGYSAALPQILRSAGVKYFCTTKISWNDTTRFPYDTFTWKGIDGSSVLVHYNTMGGSPEPRDLTNEWNWVQHKDVQDRRFYAFGHGDGGGGPTAEMCEILRRITDLEGCPKTKYVTISRFMKGIERDLANLPVWSGELYLEGHRGTLTSIAAIKRGNRKTEIALREAEFLCTLATLAGARYPAVPIRNAWKTLLTNQFHDILPGSSIAAVNDEAVRTFDSCIRQATDIGNGALDRFAGKAAAGTKSLLVFNSLSWDRRGEIVLDAVPKGLAPSTPGTISQRIESIDGRPMLAVAGVTIPALGGTRLELASERHGGLSPFTAGSNFVTTPFAVVRFDRIGRIVSFLHKASGRELVAEGGALNTILIGEDIPSAWDSWDIDSDHRLKLAAEHRLVSRKVVADGPLQLRVRSIYKLGAGSRLKQDIVFHALSERVDFETVVDWHETHRILKAGFDINVLADVARHEIQYGHTERPTHRNQAPDRARFEVAAHKWTDISEGGFGVALLNDCKYGVGVQGSTLRLSLMKSGTHPDPRGDRGRHFMTYSLLPHSGPFSVEAVVRPAYELNIPVTARSSGPSGRAPAGLLTVDKPGVIVEAVKWAEKSDGFIVRLYDAERTGGRVTVRFGTPIASVFETDLLEEHPRKLAVKDNAVTFMIRAFEIKTLLCRR